MRPRLLVSDRKGVIAGHPSLGATGMKAGMVLPLHPSELIRLPAGSQLFMMPDRTPVGLDPELCELSPQGAGHFAVGAFLPPGYTATYSPAYREAPGAKALPLFAYAACASVNDAVFVAAVRVDRERRHDSTRIRIGDVRKGVARLAKAFPRNRLIPHLAKCALSHGCCGAQNFFLGKYECPLPTSQSCNASCAGCISKQTRGLFPETQPRIRFTPTPREIAQIALFHIRQVRDTVVSFGQGCEGEPLTEGRVVEEAIRLIRAETSRGVINMNTNASRPDVIARLVDAGLDAIRVSMNSARADYYTRYYRPRGYAFRDVLRSIRVMKKAGRFVSLNYLTMPGFTDTMDEYTALRDLIRSHDVDMIQWRNLNYDPLLYVKELRVKGNAFIGVRHEMDLLRKEFPALMFGYFNPTRSKMQKSLSCTRTVSTPARKRTNFR